MSKFKRRDVLDFIEYNDNQLSPSLCEFIVGSYRRGCYEITDLDIIVINDNLTTEEIDNYFITVFRAELTTGSGSVYRRYLVTIPGYIDKIKFEVAMINSQYLGPAMCHYTGSTEENIRLRRLARDKGYSLSQYGFKSLENGEMTIPSSEQDLYEFLGEEYKSPEDR